MFSLDRSSHIPVFAQLVDHFRREIASGRLRTGESLPSTRTLAQQLGISFHTVRKAYEVLSGEDLVTAQTGRGYTVRRRLELSKAERMEQGATVVQEALARLVALGLSEREIEYVVQEQLEFYEPSAGSRKIVVAGEFAELARAAARQIESVIQQSVEAATPDQFPRHPDADLVLADIGVLRLATGAFDHIEVLPIQVQFPLEALSRIAQLHPHETLGLVVLFPASVAPLLRSVKASTGFAGQILAISLEETLARLQSFVHQVDLVAYLPDCRRRIRPLLEPIRQVELPSVVSPASIDEIRDRFQR